MTLGATSSIRNQNGNRWCGVRRLPRDQKQSSAKFQGPKKLIAFLDNKDIIHKEFVPAGQTISAVFYQAVLNRLLQHIRRVRPELHRTGKWMLFNDNAPAHCAIRVRKFLAHKMVAVLDQPPYPLILFLPTSSCFPAWRRPTKVQVVRTWMT